MLKCRCSCASNKSLIRYWLVAMKIITFPLKWNACGSCVFSVKMKPKLCHRLLFIEKSAGYANFDLINHGHIKCLYKLLHFSCSCVFLWLGVLATVGIVCWWLLVCWWPAQTLFLNGPREIYISEAEISLSLVLQCH